MSTFKFSLFRGQVSSQRYKYGVWGQQNFDLDKNAELRGSMLSSFFLSPTGKATAIRGFLWWGWGEIDEESDSCPTSKRYTFIFLSIHSV